MLRYVIQIMAMLCDVTFFAVMGLGVWGAFQEPPINPIIMLITILGVIFALKIWDENGGFRAWRPSKVKIFLENAKRMGL